MPGWREAKPREDNPWSTRYGINLQPGELVIDADPERYPDNADGTKRNVLEELMRDHALPKTRVVRTPKGGYHIYLMFPTTFTIRMFQKHYPGIDFLTEGRQPLGIGTITEHGVYILEQDHPIAQAPLDFLLMLEPKPKKQDRKGADIQYEDDRPEDIDSYAAYLYKAPPAISKQGGNNRTFLVACTGRDFGLSRERTYEMLKLQYNLKCQPPWSDSELTTLVDSAYRNGKNYAGVRSVQQDQELEAISKECKPTILRGVADIPGVPKPKPDKVEQIKDLRYQHMRTNYIFDGKGALKEGSKINARLLITAETRFKDLFYWDEFANEARFARAPWWNPNKDLPGAVDDDDMRQLLDWFGGKARDGEPYEVSNETAWFAMQQIAFLNSRHPLKEWLESIEWDGVARLDRLLVDTCDAADTEYVRLVGKNVGIGAVARIYQPGTLVKNVMILEGEQNLRKSMWIDTLGAPWSSVGAINPGEKDTYLNLSGNWIVELPEINQTLGKRDVNAVKGIVSTRVDTYRAPYERKSRRVPRQSIFIGSINPTQLGYLSDETGDTRYWPVKVNKCDIELLKKLKDQYFAEALHRYKQGEEWWLNSAQEKMAKVEQDQRKRHDPWVFLLMNNLQGAKKVTTYEIFKLTGGTSDKIGPREYERIGMSMRTLGYHLHSGDVWEKN